MDKWVVIREEQQPVQIINTGYLMFLYAEDGHVDYGTRDGKSREMQVCPQFMEDIARAVKDMPRFVVVRVKGKAEVIFDVNMLKDIEIHHDDEWFCQLYFHGYQVLGDISRGDRAKAIIDEMLKYEGGSDERA